MPNTQAAATREILQTIISAFPADLALVLSTSSLLVYSGPPKEGA